MEEMENEYREPEAPVEEPEAPVEDRPLPFADCPYEVQAAVPRKRRKPRCRKWIAGLLTVALVLGCCLGTAGILNAQWEKRLDALERSFRQQLEGLKGSQSVYVPPVSAGEAMTPAQVYAMNVPSVVMVYNKLPANMYSQGGTSTGSGFFLTSDGYVVTNYHVVEGGGTISITTWEDESYSARIVGYDDANDVALLKVEGQDFPAVTLGSSDELVVGDQVVAIGNPLGELTATQTVGYVSAKERDVNTAGFAINMIQTDAAINSGNSGGPLFNMRGQVVGITTAKYSGTSGSGASIEGIGFAIPIDDVRDLMEGLAENGYVESAYLGVSVSDMDAEEADYFNMPVGAYVEEVVEGGCAKAAGVQVKDIIIQLGDQEITGVNSLTRALRKFRAGDTTTITVVRGGQTLELDITLDEKPQAEAQEEFNSQMPQGGTFEDYFNFFRDYFGHGGN